MHPADTLSQGGHFHAPPVDELASLFPQLTVIELMGHGGMGAVYRARQNNLDRPVALKILSPRLGRDPSFAERFAREARTMARLNHPNIVTVFDFGQADDYYFLVMELIAGVNLREAILARSIDPEQALAIVPKICDALQYAHDEGVVHRDIKPENILIGPKGQVTIADFGLVKLLDAEDSRFTLTGTHQILGTRNYMAPEQIEKPGTVDHRADIYSLGVVFYELLTGELPLGRFALPSEKATINRQLDDVVMRTLEKEPARRFQQASAVKTAVESVDRSVPQSPLPPFTNGPETTFKKDVAGGSTRVWRSNLPYSNTELHGGLSQIHGIAHLDDNCLELEFRVKRLGVSNSPTKKVRIPFTEIIRTEARQGVFSNSLEVQAGSLETFDEIPGCSQGCLVMYFDKKHLEIANDFCSQLNTLSNEHPEAGQDQSMTLNRIAVKLPMEMAEGSGLAKLTEESLKIEFQTTDWLGTVQSTPRHVQIPHASVVAVNFRAGMFSDRIDVQTDSLDLVSVIPNSQQGKFSLKTARNQRTESVDFVRQLVRQSRVPLPDILAENKTAGLGLGGRPDVQRALALPRWGLPLSVAINLVFILLVAFANIPVLRTPIDKIGTDSLFLQTLTSGLDSDLLQMTNKDAVVLVVVSIIMMGLAVIAWDRLQRFRNYRRTVALLLVLALPIHFGAIASLPAGLWCLFLMFKTNARLHFE